MLQKLLREPTPGHKKYKILLTSHKVKNSKPQLMLLTVVIVITLYGYAYIHKKDTEQKFNINCPNKLEFWAKELLEINANSLFNKLKSASSILTEESINNFNYFILTNYRPGLFIKNYPGCSRYATIQSYTQINDISASLKILLTDKCPSYKKIL